MVHFGSPQKMRGAERRQALVRNAAPVACLAVTPISGSPEIAGGIAHRRASRRSAAAFFGSGPRFSRRSGRVCSELLAQAP